MFSALKRWWRYLATKVGVSLDQRADPAIQLEQAMTEAQNQHRLLRDQAANVIANQKQAELRLTRDLDEYERTMASTRQALTMAAEASASGDGERAADFTRAAESFASQLVQLEQQIEDDKGLVLAATEASAQAKAAVERNAEILKETLAQRQKLLSQLDQAKMQEQINAAVSAVRDTSGTDTPTVEQVRRDIEARYARAKGMSELNELDTDTTMREVEAASRTSLASERLNEIRAALAISTPATPELAETSPSPPPEDA